MKGQAGGPQTTIIDDNLTDDQKKILKDGIKDLKEKIGVIEKEVDRLAVDPEAFARLMKDKNPPKTIEQLRAEINDMRMRLLNITDIESAKKIYKPLSDDINKMGTFLGINDTWFSDGLYNKDLSKLIGSIEGPDGLLQTAFNNDSSVLGNLGRVVTGSVSEAWQFVTDDFQEWGARTGNKGVVQLVTGLGAFTATFPIMGALSNLPGLGWLNNGFLKFAAAALAGIALGGRMGASGVQDFEDRFAAAERLSRSQQTIGNLNQNFSSYAAGDGTSSSASHRPANDTNLIMTSTIDGETRTVTIPGANTPMLGRDQLIQPASFNTGGASTGAGHLPTSIASQEAQVQGPNGNVVMLSEYQRTQGVLVTAVNSNNPSLEMTSA